MSLERIEITPFVHLVGEILQNRRTGYLTVLKPSLRKDLYWSQGELVMLTSAASDDSLAAFLVTNGAVPLERAAELATGDAIDAVARFHESGLLNLSSRQALLREWLTAQTVPLFSLAEGTAAFTEADAIPPDKRVFLQSTATLIIEGTRAISNGLVLRRSLGDLTRTIEWTRSSRHPLESLPLTEQELAVTSALTEPVRIETFLRRFPGQPLAGKVIAMLLAIGTLETIDEQSAAAAPDFDSMQRDMELLAAIGSSDPRSLRAVGFARKLPTLDHYQVLDVPRAATRAQILSATEARRREFDPATYPPVVRETVAGVRQRIEEAALMLSDPAHRSQYDQMVQGRGDEASLQQKLTQRSIAEQNFVTAKRLSGEGDYYGAIVLLRETVRYLPDHADAWHLLGACQERNPRWRRDAAESFQRALSADPNHVEALISLGDLYRSEGLTSRAQSCYEDALKISAGHPEAKSRLQALKKQR